MISFQNEQMGDGISHSITIFSKDDIFQVQLIELVDLNELEDRYLQYLFFTKNFFLFVILYFFPLFYLSVFRPGHRKFHVPFLDIKA